MANLYDQVVDGLRQVYDPEIPVDIWQLGLIYDVEIEDGRAAITMTLTSPGCPVAPMIVSDVEKQVLAVEGIEAVNVEITFDPPWGPTMMSEAARLQLGFF